MALTDLNPFNFINYRPRQACLARECSRPWTPKSSQIIQSLWRRQANSSGPPMCFKPPVTWAKLRLHLKESFIPKVRKQIGCSVNGHKGTSSRLDFSIKRNPLPKQWPWQAEGLGKPRINIPSPRALERSWRTPDKLDWKVRKELRPRISTHVDKQAFPRNNPLSAMSLEGGRISTIACSRWKKGVARLRASRNLY